MKKDEKICKNQECNIVHSAAEIKRQYGKESAVYLGGFHSAGCYTKYLTRMKEVAPVKWTRASVLYGKLPEASKRLNSSECSDLLLIFCSDGEIRTGRFYHKTHTWLVTGVCGQPLDFVKYWAVNINNEIDKMKAKMKYDDEMTRQSEEWQSQGSNVTDV